MSHTISHSVEIDAPTLTVWNVLTTTADYPAWNPFLVRLAGDLRQGSRVEAVIAPPGRRPVTFRPTVLVVRPGRELRWRGHLLVRGLFDGEHAFELEALPGGRTRFTQIERFDGLLVRPMRSLLASTQSGFEQMNAALKSRAEESIAQSRAPQDSEEVTR